MVWTRVPHKTEIQLLPVSVPGSKNKRGPHASGSRNPSPTPTPNPHPLWRARAPQGAPPKATTPGRAQTLNRMGTERGNHSKSKKTEVMFNLEKLTPPNKGRKPQLASRLHFKCLVFLQSTIIFLNTYYAPHAFTLDAPEANRNKNTPCTCG